jgi:broad specificity phosphatase PhoE
VAIPLLLLRHGQTTWNAERRWQGWAEAPLSELGRRQAVDAAAHLPGFGFTRVVASDLGRARHTAEILAAELGLDGEVVVEPDLKERDVGAFSGRLTEDLILEFPDAFDPETRRARYVPGGEPDDAVWARVSAALVALVARFPDDRLLAVSHGGVIRTVERRLGVDPGMATPNLGGRWVTVSASGELAPGDRFVPLEPELVTEPRSE